MGKPFSKDDTFTQRKYEYIDIEPQVEVLLSARYEEGEPSHPIAWTNQKNGLKVFYMSPGGLDEMALSQVQSLLKSAVLWGLEN